jgi:hypothetical protein
MSTAETRTVTIKVTEDHIDNGRRYYCISCPIALAINEHLADGFYASVHGESSLRVVSEKGGARYAALPRQATQFIHAFDNDRNPDPIEFPLTLPVNVLKDAE